MSLRQRIWRSIRHRGVVRTLILGFTRAFIIAEQIRDRFYDRRHGTDTGGIVTVENLDTDSSNRARAIRYEPTRARSFEGLLDALAIPRSGVFVDLGCGKGRVLLLAAAYGFRRVIGVDFCASLCDAARRNADIFRSRTGTAVPIDVVHADVTRYTFQGEESVFFIFNPFDAVVLEQVMQNIDRSFADAPRDMWLIYNNPLWRYVVDAGTLFAPVANYLTGGCRFLVYRASPSGSLISPSRRFDTGDATRYDGPSGECAVTNLRKPR